MQRTTVTYQIICMQKIKWFPLILYGLWQGKQDAHVANLYCLVGLQHKQTSIPEPITVLQNIHHNKVTINYIWTCRGQAIFLRQKLNSQRNLCTCYSRFHISQNIALNTCCTYTAAIVVYNVVSGKHMAVHPPCFLVAEFVTLLRGISQGASLCFPS